MKTLNDLSKTIGCSETTLQTALDDLSLTVQECYDTPAYIADLKALLSSGGGLAVASAPAPAGLTKAEPKARRTTKLKTSPVEATKAQSKGKAGLSNALSNADAINSSKKQAFVESMYADAEGDSEARAMMLAAYPALVDRMTAEKLEAYRAQMPQGMDYAARTEANRAENSAMMEDFFSIFND